MSVLSEIFQELVKEQVEMRLDEIGENNRNIKTKAVFYTFNKAERTKGGHKRCTCRLDVDHVSDREYEDEDFEDVDKVRRGSIVTIAG